MLHVSVPQLEIPPLLLITDNSPHALNHHPAFSHVLSEGAIDKSHDPSFRHSVQAEAVARDSAFPASRRSLSSQMARRQPQGGPDFSSLSTSTATIILLTILVESYLVIASPYCALFFIILLPLRRFSSERTVCTCYIQKNQREKKNQHCLLFFSFFPFFLSFPRPLSNVFELYAPPPPKPRGLLLLTSAPSFPRRNSTSSNPIELSCPWIIEIRALYSVSTNAASLADPMRKRDIRPTSLVSNSASSGQLPSAANPLRILLQQPFPGTY
ncbi:hypothetical protein ACQKWADRAFT_273448 [Trichoderma austrokoningii]